jgi:hypothetical protein
MTTSSTRSVPAAGVCRRSNVTVAGRVGASAIAAGAKNLPSPAGLLVGWQVGAVTAVGRGPGGRFWVGVLGWSGWTVPGEGAELHSSAGIGRLVYRQGGGDRICVEFAHYSEKICLDIKAVRTLDPEVVGRSGRLRVNGFQTWQVPTPIRSNPALLQAEKQ